MPCQKEFYKLHAVPARSNNNVPQTLVGMGIGANVTARPPLSTPQHPREGKVKQTLKRELKVPEFAERKANGTSASWQDWSAE